jgi:hypothetical protein
VVPAAITPQASATSTLILTRPWPRRWRCRPRAGTAETAGTSGTNVAVAPIGATGVVLSIFSPLAKLSLLAKLD